MKDNKFTFDLQLFAETLDEGYQEPSENLEQPVADSEGEDFDFGIDENGDVFINDPNLFGTEPEPEEIPEEEQPREPELYTVTVGGQEMQVTLDELRNGYMRTSDYTRKTQALAEERRQLSQMVNTPLMQTPQPPPVPVQAEPEPEPIDQKVYYEQLAEFAKQQVSEAFGEDFDELNVSHQAALADAVATVKAQIYEQREVQRRHDAVEAQYQQLLQGYQQDPNFQEIDMYAKARLENMPYAQAVQIYKALENRDLPVIDSYMNQVRQEYYAGRQPQPQPQFSQPIPQARPKVNPPFVEKGGSANVPPEAQGKQIDFKKLGKLTTDQQAKLFSELGLSKL